MFTHIHTLSLSPSHVERKRVDDLWPSIEIKCIIIRDERSEEKMQNVQTRERELAGTGGRISLYHIFDHSFCASCCVRHFIASTACTRFCIRTANQIHAAESFSRSAEDTTERSRQTTRIHTQGHEATICIRMNTIHMTQHTHAHQSVQNVRFLYHVIHIIHIIVHSSFRKYAHHSQSIRSRAYLQLFPYRFVHQTLPLYLRLTLEDVCNHINRDVLSIAARIDDRDGTRLERRLYLLLHAFHESRVDVIARW